MATGIKTEIEGDETLNPRAPVLITFDQIKKKCKVETETNNEPITPYSGGEMCKPQDNFNSDVTGNMTETMTHSTRKMKLDNHCKKRVTCSVCNKSVMRKSNLKYHLRIHSGERPYKCVKCDKGFISKSSLTYHLGIHSGVKPYKCEKCAKCYALKSSLNKHILSHNHYNCKTCGMSESCEDCLYFK